jgi:hypothetical protein
MHTTDCETDHLIWRSSGGAYISVSASSCVTTGTYVEPDLDVFAASGEVHWLQHEDPSARGPATALQFALACQILLSRPTARRRLMRSLLTIAFVTEMTPEIRSWFNLGALSANLGHALLHRSASPCVDSRRGVWIEVTLSDYQAIRLAESKAEAVESYNFQTRLANTFAAAQLDMLGSLPEPNLALASFCSSNRAPCQLAARQ